MVYTSAVYGPGRGPPVRGPIPRPDRAPRRRGPGLAPHTPLQAPVSAGPLTIREDVCSESAKVYVEGLTEVELLNGNILHIDAGPLPCDPQLLPSHM